MTRQKTIANSPCTEFKMSRYIDAVVSADEELWNRQSGVRGWIRSLCIHSELDLEM